MRHSTVTERNPEVTERGKETNLTFFAAVGKALVSAGHTGEAAIGLGGGGDLFSCALRQAQAVVRWDYRASYWSHAFLVAGPLAETPEAVANTPVLECTLTPYSPAVHTPERNGVTVGRLTEYSEDKYPNVAIISFRLQSEEAAAIISRGREPNLDRLRYNFWDLLGVWREYLWSLGAKPNPLLEGHRLFNAAYCEMAYEAVGIDLTPGASERNSSPEHLWNTALWWWQQFKNGGHPVQVHYIIRQPGLPESQALSPQIGLEEMR